MSLKVLNQHLVHAIGSGRVAAGVTHRASAAVEVLPHDHGHLPEAGVRSRGARRDHAVVEELVVEGVRPAGRSVLVDRHRRVVREVRLPQHFEHVVAADLQRVAPRFFFPLSLYLESPLKLVSAFDGWTAIAFGKNAIGDLSRASEFFFLFRRGGGNVAFEVSLWLGFKWLNIMVLSSQLICRTVGNERCLALEGKAETKILIYQRRSANSSC